MPRLERLAADFSTVCKRDDPDRQGRACLQHTAYAVAPAFDDESPPFGQDGTAATQVTAGFRRFERNRVGDRYGFVEVQLSLAAIIVQPVGCGDLLLHFDQDEAGSQSVNEIGRASCRERVCQYEYISVVAVSIKKK